MTHAEFFGEATRRFGPDQHDWRFVCPCCGHEARAADWLAAGAPQSAIGFSCVGRWSGAPRDAFGEGPGPCNYAGGGLFELNPMDVDGARYFNLAAAPGAAPAAEAQP